VESYTLNIATQIEVVDTINNYLIMKPTKLSAIAEALSVWGIE